MVKIIKKILIIIIILSSACSYALSISESLSKNPVAIGETFEFIVTVASDKSENISTPKPTKRLDPFTLNGTRQSSSVSTQISFSKMVTKVSKQFHFSLSSQKEGEWMIPPFSFTVSGKSYQTKSTKLQVSSKVKKGLPSGTFGNAFDRFFQQGQGFPRLFNHSRRKISKGQFILQAEVKKLQVYRGEMLPFDLALYQQRGLPHSVSITHRDLIQLENFWTEKIKSSDQLAFQSEKKFKGITYLKATLEKLILFPLKVGVNYIPSIGIDLAAQDMSNFFNSNSSIISLRTKKIRLDVLPLPKKLRGIFIGGVGDFNITAQTKVKKIKATDILSYRIRIEGRGNVQEIKLPPWPKDTGFKVYNIVESHQFSPNNSYKEFEILLSSQKTGSLSTPKFSWTTFNPELKSYVWHDIPSINIEVDQAKKPILSSNKKYFTTAQNPETETKLKSKPSQPILQSLKERFYSPYRAWIWSLLLALFLAVIVWKYLVSKKAHKRQIRQMVADSIKKAELEVEEKKLTSAGITLINIMDQLFYSIIGTKGREIYKILEECPPSIRKSLGYRIEILIKNLEILSFSDSNQHKATQDQVREFIEEMRLLTHEIIKYQKL